ncbi:hypothetical protein [Schaalia sp. JY-X169]|uniref:hypothetical protein n=1 Tax=Schaalia sp. JY-X169 TaxID=2758572 RepID=UPI0015F41A6B
MPKNYLQSFKDRFVRMVTDRLYEEDGPSQCVVMREGVPRLGVATETLRRLCMKAQVDAGIRPGVTTVEIQELPL